MKNMPMVFIGHGLPINAIEKNSFTVNWKKTAQLIPKPRGILCISAHWATKGNFVNITPIPRTIHQIKDIGHYPDELAEVLYMPPGATDISNEVYKLFMGEAKYDPEYGIDNGAWVVLRQMYPKADIPVTQLSVNVDITPYNIFELGTRLRPLRQKGILILASGNIVHNPDYIDFHKLNGFNWADEFDKYIRNSFVQKDFNTLANYKNAGDCVKRAFKEPSHLYPLIYAAGATSPKDTVRFFNDKRIYGALSMTSFLISE